MPDVTDAAFAPGKPDYTALTFPPAPAGRPYLILNMVESADGRATVEGTERGLGSPADQRLMRELRVHADVVLNGASTLRASGSSPRLGDPALEAFRESRGKRRAPYAAVISTSGALPLDRLFFTGRDFEALVYLSDSASEDRRAAIAATGRTVIRVPRGDELRTMLRHMHDELTARLVLVEGGPTLNGALLDGGFVDELFVTIGGVLVGGTDPLTIVQQHRPRSLEETRHLRLLSAHPNPETNEVYLRYRLLPLAVPGSGSE